MANSWLDEYESPNTPAKPVSNWLDEYESGPDFSNVASGSATSPIPLLPSAAQAQKSSAPVDRTWEEALSDSATRVRQGLNSVVGGIVGAPVNLANLAYGLPHERAIRSAMGIPTETLQQPDFVKGIRESLARDNAREETGLSKKAKAQAKAFQEADGLVGSAKFLAQNPSYLGTEAAAQLPQLLQLVPGTAAGTIAAQAVGAASQNAQQVEEALRQRGMSEEEAAIAAQKAFGPSLAVNAALPLIPGGSAVERMLAGQAGKAVAGSAASRLAVPLLGETVAEGLQEGADQVIQNAATGDPLSKGVGQATVLGTALGAPSGAIAGGVDAALAPRAMPNERTVRLAEEVAGRVRTPESDALDAGREAARAMHEQASAEVASPEPITPPVIPEPKSPDSVPERKTPDFIPQNAERIAELEAKPEPTLFEREELSLLKANAPELANNGKSVIYRGDVEAMRAKLKEAGLSEGMRVMQDDEAVGLRLPVGLKEKADALISQSDNGVPIRPKPNSAVFTTSKGSKYIVHDDGTTTRDKAKRDDAGHEGDYGVKQRSERTVYVDVDPSVLSAAGLNNIGPKGARVIVRDGKASLLMWNEKAGKWGISPSSKDVRTYDEPAVGRFPLELWKKKDDVNGYEAYSGMHAGNKITEISNDKPPVLKSKRAEPGPLPEPEKKPTAEGLDVGGVSPEDALKYFGAKDNVVEGLKSAAGFKDSFKYGKSDKTTLPDIFRDIEPGYKAAPSAEMAEGNETPADMAWRVTTPEGDKAAVYQKGNEVWIDVSDLDQGQGGQRIYNAVANYAKNNGLKFAGDPAGLSDVAMKRRTENMLSSALKHGTTDHLKPHEKQLQGNQELGIPALKWKEGDTEHNIRELARVTSEVTGKEFPETLDIRYNPDKLRFERNGEEVTSADFNALAGAKRLDAFNAIRAARGKPPVKSVGADDLAALDAGDRAALLRSFTAGGTTLKRAVLAKQLASGEGEGLSRSLAESGKVDAERAAGLADTRKVAPESLKETFYSKGEKAAQKPLERPEIDADVKRVFGTAKPLNRLINNGAVELITKADAVKKGLGSESDLAGVKGLHDGKKGYLITDELRPNEVAGVLLHEIGVHHSMEKILGKPLFDRLQRATESFKARGDKDVVKAYEAVPKDTAPQYVNHEAMAYLAEHSANHKVTERMVDATKLFLNRLGVPLSYMKAEPAAIRKIARESLLAESRGEGKPIRYVNGKTLYSQDESKRQTDQANGFKIKPPKRLYRGVNDDGSGYGTYMLGRGIYSSRDKSFAKKYGEKVVEINPEEGWPRNPLVIHNAIGGAPQAFMDWALSESGLKNAREFNAKYPDPANFIKSRGFDGVIAGDEVVRFTDDLQKYSKRTPAENEDPTPKFNSATEFWTDNIGKPLFNTISRATKAVIANDFLKARGLNLAEDMPPEAQKAWRAYKQDVGDLKKTVAEIGEEAKKLSPEERAMVSDLVEREMQAGVTPPESVVRMATLMTSIMRKQSQQLVETGMLSKDAADRWEGRYLPRFYQKHILTNPFDAMLRKAYLSGIKGSHLKGRGLFESIPVEDVPAYEKMGWELRDPTLGKQPDLKGLEKGSKIRVWRDFTPAERQKMGEVRDAMYRFARGYTDTQIDIAKGKLFDHIARTVARDDDPGGSYVLVPDTSVPGTGVKKFGNLAGKYVPGDVLAALKTKAGPDSDLTRAYLKTLSYWKLGKTALSLRTHVNNVVSNVVMADLAGVNLADPRSWKLYADTFNDYRKEGKWYKEAQKAGLFGGEWYGNEVGQYLPLPAELKDVGSRSIPGKFAMKTVNAVSSVSQAMGKAYQAEDQFFKLLLYKQARERGLDSNDAVTWAEKFVFDYSTAAPGVTKLKNTLFPFANYSSKAVPALTFAATHYPWRIAKWIGLLGAFSLYAGTKLYGDDKEKMMDAEAKALPEYLRGRSSFFGVPKAIRLPYNDESTGDGMYVDISRFLPLGDLFDANNQAGGVPLPAPLTPNNPLITTAIAMLANKDSFTGKEVVRESDTSGEAAQKRLAWLYRQMAPNNPLVPGSYDFNRIVDAAAAMKGEPIGPYTGLDYNGNTISPGRALAQTFGIKLRSVDFEKEIGWQESDLKRELTDLKGQKTKLKRNKSISEATLESELDKLDEKIDDVNRRLDELSNIPTPRR